MSVDSTFKQTYLKKKKTKKNKTEKDEKKAEGENKDGEKQLPAGTTDVPTCTFLTLKHFETLFKLL